MKLRTYLPKWDYIPHPPKPTIQIGWLFISTHFPGVRCWGFEILSTGGLTCISRHGCTSIEKNWVETTLRKVIFSRWRDITLRLGEYLIHLCLTAEREEKYRLELDRADTSLR